MSDEPKANAWGELVDRASGEIMFALPDELPDGYVKVHLDVRSSIIGSVGYGAMCERCGALVGSSTAHDSFHDLLD